MYPRITSPIPPSPIVLRAVTVCVDYGDLLEVTLDWNLHHFAEVLVITTSTDTRTIAAAKNYSPKVEIHTTDAFYANGAYFNKWAALEEGLTSFGRKGWIALIDADILWPKQITPNYAFGNLYSPRRRMQLDISMPYPPEHRWHTLPIYGDYQWAGYTQIFHADDPVLPDPPWHELDWLHAGGADSAFQNLWPETNKIRPDWQVVHLGLPGRNWCGRATKYRDGTIPSNAENRELVAAYLYSQRRVASPQDRYRAERLPPCDS